jgi:hypothetical protein
MQNESTTIFGESTKATLQSVVSSLKTNTQLSNTSLILDIGSELGQPTMHFYIDPGVALSFGVEVSRWRHVMAIENLEKVLNEKEAEWTNKGNGYSVLLAVCSAICPASFWLRSANLYRAEHFGE